MIFAELKKLTIFLEHSLELPSLMPSVGEMLCQALALALNSPSFNGILRDQFHFVGVDEFLGQLAHHSMSFILLHYNLLEAVFHNDPCYFQQHCAREKLHLRIRFKPSLFQHVGKESSLKGKKQNLIVSTMVENGLNEPNDVFEVHIISLIKTCFG